MAAEVWIRELNLIRGPFKFSYKATYTACEDGFWKLVNFQTCGYESIGNFPLDQKIQLIQKFGRQAARAAHEEAERRINLPSMAR